MVPYCGSGEAAGGQAKESEQESFLHDKFILLISYKPRSEMN